MRPEGTTKPLRIGFGTLLLAGVVLGLDFGGCVPRAKPDSTVIQVPTDTRLQYHVPPEQRGKIHSPRHV
jgi:hypothetical protein